MSHSFNDADPELLEFINRAKRGDRAAFPRIVAATQDRLYRFCHFLCHSPTAAEELAQETYLRALSRLDQLTEPRGIFVWLFRIAKNLFIDATRTGEHHVENASDSLSPRPADPPGFLRELPDTQPGDIEVTLTVRTVLQKLDPDERALILLVDHEGLSYGEAATALDTTEAAVRAKLHKVRQKFMRIFKKR